MLSCIYITLTTHILSFTTIMILYLLALTGIPYSPLILRTIHRLLFSSCNLYPIPSFFILILTKAPTNISNRFVILEYLKNSGFHSENTSRNSGCEQLPFIHITLFVFLRKPETFLPYLPHQPSHINHMTAVLLQNL